MPRTVRARAPPVNGAYDVGVRWTLVGLVLLVSACSSTTPQPSSISATPTKAASPSPTLDAEQLWGPSTIDSAPGPVVASAIADLTRVPVEDVRAAVFLVKHESERNGVSIEVFSAAGFTAEELGIRWLRSQTPDCDPVGPRDVLFAGFPARVTHQLRNDQCLAEYVVLLDDDVVAVLTDDEGYTGNDPANPPPVPERPVDEIEALLPWLVQELEAIELLPGAQPLVQG